MRICGNQYPLCIHRLPFVACILCLAWCRTCGVLLCAKEVGGNASRITQALEMIAGRFSVSLHWSTQCRLRINCGCRYSRNPIFHLLMGIGDNVSLWLSWRESRLLWVRYVRLVQWQSPTLQEFLLQLLGVPHLLFGIFPAEIRFVCILSGIGVRTVSTSIKLIVSYP